jgi:hypothetical protein
MSKQIPSLKVYVKKINDTRKTREKNDVFRNKVDVPTLGVKRIAEMCRNQDRFVMQESLVGVMLSFYACNTGIFKCAIAKDLQEAVEFDEKYIDECLVDIADLIMQGKVYWFYDGVFRGMSLHKQAKKDKPVGWEEAADFCNSLIEGDF